MGRHSEWNGNSGKGRTGWGCESFPYLRLNTIFLFTLLQSLRWGRGRKGDSRSPKFICSYFQELQVSVSTYIIELLSVIYLYQQILYKSRVNSNSTSGLCWSLPESVLMLGKKWLLGLTCVVKWRVCHSPQHYSIPHYYWLCLYKVIGCPVTPQAQQMKHFLECPDNRAPGTLERSG